MYFLYMGDFALSKMIRLLHFKFQLMAFHSVSKTVFYFNNVLRFNPKKNGKIQKGNYVCGYLKCTLQYRYYTIT